MSDFDKIIDIVSSNSRDLSIIAQDLIDGNYTDEKSVLTAFNSVCAAQQNAAICYDRLVSSVDSVPFMVAASVDTDVFGQTVQACQEMKTQADILYNVMASEFGIVADDDESEEADDVETDEDEDTDTDEDDGENMDNENPDEIKATASELRKYATNNVTASAGGKTPLFDFIGNL